MLDRVLVPLDGSELGDAILRHIGPLLLTKDAEVVLVRVLPESAGEAELVAAGSHLESCRLRLAEGGARVTARIERGDPAAKILEVADAFEPALIAASTHGRSGVMRWARGSVAERLLERARAPLLLANPHGVGPKKSFGFRRILVPLDGSPTGAAILPLVHELARTYEAEVLLLHAVELPRQVALGEPLAVHAAAGLAEEERTRAERMLARFAARLGGVPVHVVVAWGSAAAAIIDRADAEGADLIALTTHGQSAPSRWLYGSVARLVVRHATCPLLVVRTGGDAA
jgi:nucleotide-binding universal stress UspA family protein